MSARPKSAKELNDIGDQIWVSAQCRDLRHSFESIGDTVLLERKGQVKRFQRTLECTRCETLRVDTYQMAGHSVLHEGTRYTYPQGYVIKGGIRVSEARYLLFRNVEMVEEK